MDLNDKEQKTTVNNWKNRHFFQSLRYAIIGLKTAYREERNLRFHVSAITLVVIMGLAFNVTIGEWLWLFLSIFLVVSSEVWNSAIENVVDLATNYKRHPLAKKAKDMAAAAVLLAAIFSVITGLLIFGPKIWQLLFN
ncbi:diacylglycerol kinase [Ligilactobacillus apodemi DSM 16634 = JCM 16172]|uniref:Diacylglycerol kinase n=1 Tax=Ligilactobacillus apodemi DSM 16634 = JCM 16172 TaxID=1423724 RepID=A0A0R1TY56_9LACO|nr:diacylglycerol kinase family protein [Ligilactobacillus apodemi]KRL83978.1 diacylglycerol kinase [Ligilactobacillus apodemi DSM 16634 = JCM 16172]MCR1900819.1 diacylglycerol kinase family protein [Ligilactobacillus apodemi]